MTTTTDRRASIGASEAAAAIGIHPFTSRTETWGLKTGRLEPADLSEVERVQWGIYLQPEIARRFADKTGRTVRQNRSDVSRSHPDHPWMTATLDATQRINGGVIGELEIKTTNAFNAEQWRTEPPLYYQVQLVHQMLVTGHRWGTLAVLIGGQKLVWQDFVREGVETSPWGVSGLTNPIVVSSLLEERLIASEAVFWQLIQTDTPPPPDGSAQTADALKRLYGIDNGAAVELPPEAAEWDAQLQEAKADKKAAEAIETKYSNKLKAAIGEASYGLLPGGARYKWKSQPRAGYTVEDGTTKPLVRMKK